MNLSSLFDAQKKLREHINYNGEDRMSKNILEFQVEVGECANEFPEYFKYWSNKKNNFDKGLVEYADGLAILLELGMDADINPSSRYLEPSREERLNNILVVFHQVIGDASNLYWNHHYKTPNRGSYIHLFQSYLRLGELLGFTWEQIEQAYYNKNQINHERQNNGY